MCGDAVARPARVNVLCRLRFSQPFWIQAAASATLKPSQTHSQSLHNLPSSQRLQYTRSSASSILNWHRALSHRTALQRPRPSSLSGLLFQTGRCAPHFAPTLSVYLGLKALPTPNCWLLSWCQHSRHQFIAINCISTVAVDCSAWSVTPSGFPARFCGSIRSSLIELIFYLAPSASVFHSRTSSGSSGTMTLAQAISWL